MKVKKNICDSQFIKILDDSTFGNINKNGKLSYLNSNIIRSESLDTKNFNKVNNNVSHKIKRPESQDKCPSINK